MSITEHPTSKASSWRRMFLSATQLPGWERLTSLFPIILRRVAFGIVVLLTISYLSHFGLEMSRGMDFQSALGRALVKTSETLGRIFSGDLGVSPAASSTLNPLPIAAVVPQMLSKSLGLLGVTLVTASVIGIVLGIWTAGRRRPILSLLIMLISIVGVSVPSFFAAILLQMGVIRLTRILGKTFLPVGGFGWDLHLVLPVLVLAARPIAQIARVTFVSINEVIAQDYVRTAHGKGVPPRRVMNHHVMRNVAVPIATTIGMSLRFSLSSLPVVEFFFGWSGLGFYLLKAIAQKDDNLTVILVLCLGVLFITVNLVLDLIYRIFDPRLRELTSRVQRAERKSLWNTARLYMSDFRDWLTLNSPKRWRERRKEKPSDQTYSGVIEGRKQTIEENLKGSKGGTRKAWLGVVLRNIPFLIGLTLVATLLVIAFFGHGLSPHSPYTTQGLKIEEGKISVPPFEPDEVYPWGTDVLGRDIMSLVLSGAWQTIRLAAMVVLARMVVGFILGSIAGWLHDRWIDRVLLGLAEIISAFPALLLAMTLILALGIREGLGPFVIALCFVGWGEVMQFVRGEVMTMRPKTFIEGAVAIGMRTPRIIVNHVLPNLVPALISLTALEMGAVLMLLGELGFVGIFIGGGAFAELDINAAPYHYSDVPEWSALLSNVRTHIYGYPWTALYPAMAFFIAILGFNLFGEGLRRLVDDLGVRITRFVNRYTVAFTLGGVMLVGWVYGSTGAVAVYQNQAEVFDGQRAFSNVEALSDPALEGRAIGTVGMEVAAEWIAQQFQTLGLQAAGENLTYFQIRPRGYEVLDRVPILAIEDGGSPLAYHQDYVEYPGFWRNMGQALGTVRFIGLGEHNRSYYRGHPALERIDFAGEILLVLNPLQAGYVSRVPRAGVLVIADDPTILKRIYTLSSIDPNWDYWDNSRDDQDVPMLWISESAANRLLAGTVYTVDDLRLMSKSWNWDEMVEIPTGILAAMDVEGTVDERANVRHVIGHLPGTYGLIGHQLDDRLIVVLAQYDNPPLNPDGSLYLGANDNASGLAVMLEAIRTLQKTGYQPYKTFLFVAFSGEGREGGSLVPRPEIANLLQAKHGFSLVFEIEAVIELRGLGAGEGEGLILSTGGSLRLANLFEDVARHLGVQTTRAGELLDISVVFESGSSFDSGEEGPQIGLSWEGWGETSRTSGDTVEAISAEKLEKAGEVLSLALMIIGREIQY